MPQFLVLLSAVAIGIGVAGCTSTVSASDVAQQAKTKYNQQFAALGSTKKVVSVNCPNDLNATVGASEVCSAVGSPGQVHFGIKATVTSVNGGTAHIEYVTTAAPSSQTGTSTG